jgi:hypothetical protein
MTMMASWRLLPLDLIELQLGQIDLLLAMYPEDITIDASSQTTLDTLKSLEDESSKNSFAVAPLVSTLLQVIVPLDTTPNQHTLELDLTFPFFHDGEGDKQPEDPPQVKVRICQPFWLSRAATAQLMTDLPEEEDLLGTIEHIKDAAEEQLKQAVEASNNSSSQSALSMNAGPLVRVWFYFPSISTRSKRDDFIIHAPSYQLTGFLYAGKPGLLCVEGGSQAIDDYMKWIKTESWGDIPAHHKKVSERYRETKEVERVFEDMTEITDMVGERRGQRANRGDMKAMEDWLTERGLGEAFAKVLM